MSSSIFAAAAAKLGEEDGEAVWKAGNLELTSRRFDETATSAAALADMEA